MQLAQIKALVNTSPAFILDADSILSQLQLFKQLQQQANFKLLFAIKALPLDAILKLVAPHVQGFAVSSLFEAQLVHETTTSNNIHLTTPGIRAAEIATLARLCSHINFNSQNQYQRFAAQIKSATLGMRLNPKLSFLHDQRFNPCGLHSKLGVDIAELSLPMQNIQGLHFHTVFSATDFQALIQTLKKLQSHFGTAFKDLAWLNLGGGYLFNQITEFQSFITCIQALNANQATEIFIEPGKAIVNDAGYLLTTVIDILPSDGKTIAILDTSVNHHPEVFEYQRAPKLCEANSKGKYQVILAGSTCLAGDVFGEYSLEQELKIGDKLVFKQLGAYSLIKANRFNGYNLPDIYWHQAGNIRRIKQYQYCDYQQQWSSEC